MANRPNADYYANNITLHNFNIVDASSGVCSIALYDEREASKDGNAVCSLRYANTKDYLLANKNKLPSAECKVLDNCVAQNKSNTTHKFSMLLSLIFFPNGVSDIYFRVGHSHNLSDQKTAHAHKALAKKNLYTPRMIQDELNKTKGLEAYVFDSFDGIFLDFKSFLDKHFPNMEPGFTSYYVFEFKQILYEMIPNQHRWYYFEGVGEPNSNSVGMQDLREEDPPTSLTHVSPRMDQQEIVDEGAGDQENPVAGGSGTQRNRAADESGTQRNRAAEGSRTQRNQAAEGSGTQRNRASEGSGTQRNRASEGSGTQRSRAAEGRGTQRTRPGRPRQIQTAVSNQPAIHLYFSQSGSATQVTDGNDGESEADLSDNEDSSSEDSNRSVDVLNSNDGNSSEGSDDNDSISNDGDEIDDSKERSKDDEISPKKKRRESIQDSDEENESDIPALVIRIMKN